MRGDILGQRSDEHGASHPVLAALRDTFAGQDAGQRLAFDMDFAEPAIGRAYEEAKGKISDE